MYKNANDGNVKCAKFDFFPSFVNDDGSMDNERASEQERDRKNSLTEFISSGKPKTQQESGALKKKYK